MALSGISLIRGQYLQLLERLHGSMFIPVKVWVWVEALTEWSDRFLFLRFPNINLASLRNRVVFDLFNSGQFVSIMSLSGGLEGLCVLTR